jgi:hypothetical protein
MGELWETRHRLDAMNDRRRHQGWTASEAAEYIALVDRELQLILGEATDHLS